MYVTKTRENERGRGIRKKQLSELIIWKSLKVTYLKLQLRSLKKKKRLKKSKTL